jgi:Ras-related protein Rab-32
MSMGIPFVYNFGILLDVSLSYSPLEERFGNMTRYYTTFLTSRVYYKEAVAAFVVFDITRAQTFEAVKKWKQDIDHKVFLPDEKPIPCVLLANKCDLKEQTNSKIFDEMNNYVQENGFAGWFETSAKEDKGIEDACKFLVEKILENHVVVKEEKRDVITISKETKTPQETSGGGFCCK